MIARIILIIFILSLWHPQENRDFFVVDGEPQCLVLYGENSADFESAKIIAEKIVEISKKKEEIFPYLEENYSDKNNLRTSHCDFIVVGNTSGYFNEKPYISLPLWYDDKNLNGKLDKDESREEIFINFSEENNIFPVLNIGDLRYRAVIEELPMKKLWKSGEKNVYIYENAGKVRFLNQDFTPLEFFQSIGENVVLFGDPYEKEFPIQDNIEFQGWKVHLGEEYTVIEPNGNTHSFDPADLVYVQRNVCSLKEITIFAMKIEDNKIDIYVLRNYGALQDTTGIKIGSDEWSLNIRSLDIEYEDVNDMSPVFKDGDIEYIIELRNYSPLSENIYITEFHIPPCGLSEGSYTGRIFFSLEITDLDPHDKEIDSVKMIYKKVIQESFLRFLIKDIELTEEIRNSYNIISVGGPGYTKTERGINICNLWTKALTDQELSKVDWYISEGEWEYIEDNKTLIVAGKDREATRRAAEELVESL